MFAHLHVSFVKVLVVLFIIVANLGNMITLMWSIFNILLFRFQENKFITLCVMIGKQHPWDLHGKQIIVLIAGAR